MFSVINCERSVSSNVLVIAEICSRENALFMFLDHLLIETSRLNHTIPLWSEHLKNRFDIFLT